MNNSRLSDNQIAKGIRNRQTIIKVSKFISIISYLCIIGLPLGFIFNYALGGRGIWDKLMIAGIITIPVGIINGKMGTKQKKNLKTFIGQYLVKDVIAEKIDIIEYSPNPNTDSDLIKKCTILPHYDKINCSDYINGTYNGVELTYCDLTLEQEYQDTDDDGHTSTHYKTVFQGHLINLSLKQKIDGFVKIKERRNSKKEKGFFSNVLSGAADVLGIKTKDESIEVENETFNNKFEIKTNNQQMAFYILTPQFMEKIVNADELAHGYTNIEFRGKNAFITINNGHDSFEITKNVISKKTLEKKRQQMRNELNCVLTIIDEIIAKDNLF